MQQLPFDKPGQFWRGNLHTHSTVSDGRLSPGEVCEFYREAGYDFLAITDHFLPHYDFAIADTQPYRKEGFTTLIGAELHTDSTTSGDLWHILAVGLPPDFAKTDPGESGPQLVERAMAAGAYVAVAHPSWYCLSEAEILSLGHAHAIETYNATSLDHNDRPDSWPIMDLLLTRGYRYFACATDDAHFMSDRHDAACAWVQVKSETLEPANLLAALKAGHYYSSTGPEIYDIQVIPGDQIVVRCSPASRIYVTGAGAQALSTHGTGIREAAFNLKTFESPFCRITVRDAHNQRAWSNPIWFDNGSGNA